MKKNNLRKSKIIRKEGGITLVALIITIIVLLILAMVSISLVMNSGIIDKSKYATDKYSEEEIGEQLKLVYSEYQMSQLLGETRTAEQFITAKLQEIFGNDNISNVLLANNKLKATIYEKLYIYNVSTGKAGEYVDPFNYGEKTKATLAPGDTITLETEQFMVFSVANGEIKAMPYYNLKLDSNPIKQAKGSGGYSSFSSVNYWTQGEDAIDMSNAANNIQQYITKYKTTLETLGADVEVRAARYSELSISDITNKMRNPGQSDDFWFGSSYHNNITNVWRMKSDGNIENVGYNYSGGVRPIIIIS